MRSRCLWNLTSIVNRESTIRIGRTTTITSSFATAKDKGGASKDASKEKGEKKAKGLGTKPMKGKKKGTEDDSGMASVESLSRFIEVAEAAKRFKPAFSPEELAEHARIAKEYRRESMKRHNRHMKDLSTKICLQRAAIDALPEGLREQALIIDETPPPANRPWANWSTPPIPGFDAKAYQGKKDDDDEEEEDESVVSGKLAKS